MALKRGTTIIELLVALLIAAIVIEMAWNVFGNSMNQFALRRKESDSLKSIWLDMRSHWKWNYPPDSIKGSLDSCFICN